MRAGVLAAVATWSIVVLPALIGWLAAPESTLGWFSAVSVASGLWFLGHAQSIAGSGAVVSVTPLVLLLLNIYVTTRFARRLLVTQRSQLTAADWNGVLTGRTLPGFVGGYTAIAAIVAVLTIGGPMRPGALAVVGAALVPVAALGFLVLRPEAEHAPTFVRRWFDRAPSWLAVVWRVGWRGSGLLLLVGLALVLLRVALSVGAVASMQGDYRVNLVGAAVLVAGQLLMVGNAATWALGFVAGPGFSIAAGSVISPAATNPGLNPSVPLLAALPEQADYPPVMYAVVLVPVAVGVLLARRVDAELDFFGSGRVRCTAVVTAAAIASVVVVVVTALGNGALGVDRLSSVGVPVVPFAGALIAEVVAGALAHTGWRIWSERRALVETETETEAEAEAEE